MKILFPFVGDSVGGSHISSLNLYLGLIDNGFDVIIIVHNDNGPLSKYLVEKKIPFITLNAFKLAGSSPNKISILFSMLINCLSFGKFIINNNIDIVHGNDLRINLSWSLPTKLLLKKKFIWHQRTILSQSKFWFLIKYLCDYFVAISDVVMKSAPKNILNKKIVYNPFVPPSLPINREIERSIIVNKYKLPKECFLMGCVGRVVDCKNIDFVIENLHNIFNNLNKNIYLIIVGTGETEYIDSLKELAKKTGVNNRLIFTGFVNNPSSAIASLDLLVAPSNVDAFGRTIVEAMLHKTLVLAANYGGHREIVVDKINGFLYEPNIIGDFTKKITNIMNNSNFDKLSDRAYDYALSNFSFESHIKNILFIYDILMKK